MGQRFVKIGRETLEMADTAPLDLLRQIVDWREDEDGPPSSFVWPEDDDEDAFRQSVKVQLDEKSIDFLRPIEDRCIRIRQLASLDGMKSLKHVAKERLPHEEYETLEAQPDELCASIWVFLHQPADFRDAEAFHAVRKYRDHGKMYDAFEVDAGGVAIADVTAADLRMLEASLTKKLELPSEVSITTLNLAATSNHSPSFLVIVRHPGPLSSVFHHKDGGARKTIYYRPPNEASLIWTPQEKMIEVCGPSPEVRRHTAETFAEVAFKTDLSKKPLSWRYYDLSRFHSSLTLTLPAWDDIAIDVAKVIEVEMRLGSWSRRLSLRVTVKDDIDKIAARWIGGNRLLKHAEGFSRVSIAVKYTTPENPKKRSLEISFGDRRSNLQSKASAADRELGQRLLQFWGILKRLKPLEYDDVTEILLNLLELHDLPEDEVSGGQLRRLGLDAKRLLDGGVIEFKSRQSMILLDDLNDDLVIEPSIREGELTARDRFEGVAGAVTSEDTRMYAVKRDWLDQVVIEALRPLIGKTRSENLTDDLIYLGSWDQSGQRIPMYLARRVEHTDRLAKMDLALRGRQEVGIGIVLTATVTPFRHLGPNVVVPLPDFLDSGKLDGSSGARLMERFKADRWLAMGGSEVALFEFGKQMAMLYIPGKIPLPVIGHQQVTILERLVKAHKASAPGVVTGHLIEGTGVRSPADAWNSKTKKSVSGVYFENFQPGFWRLKVN